MIYHEVARKSLILDLLKAKLMTSEFSSVMKIIYIQSSIHHMFFCSEIPALTSLEQKYMLSYSYSSAAS